MAPHGVSRQSSGQHVAHHSEPGMAYWSHTHPAPAMSTLPIREAAITRLRGLCDYSCLCFTPGACPADETEWNHDHIDIVPDSVPLYDEIEKTYKDMTLDLVGKYNEWISDKPELQLEFDDDDE